MFRDRETDLSALERLIVKLEAPERQAELSAEEWPLAIVAYALQQSEDQALLEPGSRAIYSAFEQHTEPAARAAALSRLGRFVAAQKGGGWRALLFFALCETRSAELSTRAATLTLNSAPPSAEERFTGAAALVQALTQGASTPLLNALLSTADLRLQPLLAPLYELPVHKLALHLDTLQCTVNSLSAAYITTLLSAHPNLAENATQALVRMIGITPLVADLVYPMPTWSYTNPTPQPLHAWTPAEYLPRMLPSLKAHLTPRQIETLRAAFV